MQAWLLEFTLVASILEHLIPIIGIIAFLCMLWGLKVYLPQFKYITLVANANDHESVVKLAKYMATKNGGKHIETCHLWQAFIPAAIAVNENYKSKAYEAKLTEKNN